MSPLLPRTRYSLGIHLLASHSVMAANLPGDQDLIRDRQNRLLEEQQRRLEQLKDLPGKEAKPEAPVTPVDSRCFPIQCQPTRKRRRPHQRQGRPAGERKSD